MKNVKLNLDRKSGFSLVEMLVVIAIIGIIAAIAIPNIGNINESAKQATAKRNAQSIASVVNAAIAAGAPVAGADAAAVIVTAGGAGFTPTSGPFSGKKFSITITDEDDQAEAAAYLVWDNTNKTMTYNGSSKTTP